MTLRETERVGEKERESRSQKSENAISGPKKVGYASIKRGPPTPARTGPTPVKPSEELRKCRKKVQGFENSPSTDFFSAIPISRNLPKKSQS